MRTEPTQLDSLWNSPNARVLVLRNGELPVESESGMALALMPVQSAALSNERHFLGLDPSGAAIFMVREASDQWETPTETQWVGLREIGAALNDRDSGIAVTAIALDNWHRTHQRCPRCGEPTQVTAGGWVRKCSADGSEHYPRTDPAVIMLVRDENDRALLGHQVAWPDGWFSTLAGFVEPGESAEAAVRREVQEESGVIVGSDPDDVVYLGSQPWPFPNSLMLGFHARASETAVHADGVEIGEARWFSRDELRDASAAGDVRIPPAISIARRLIERWYGEPLPGSWSRP